MIFDSAITAYLQATRNHAFIRHTKSFAERLGSALTSRYSQGFYEPSIVKAIEDVVNNLSSFSSEDQSIGLEIITRAVFIHGGTSRVEFDFYNARRRKELGDIMFLASLVHKGEKCFEKLTINQVKKDKLRIRQPSWNIDKEQLYLLARFPTFVGSRGSIVRPTRHNLPNYSGCLGSYGLLSRPGDFAFASATDLDSYLGHTDTLAIRDQYSLRAGSRSPVNLRADMFSNHHFAQNAFDFAEKYVALGIGESIFAMVGGQNSHALAFVHQLLRDIRTTSTRAAELVNGFFQYSYASPDLGLGPTRDSERPSSGRLGIIHTTINVQE